MNEMVNKFSLEGDKFMPKMHFKQHGFTYKACQLFIGKKERTKNSNKQEIQHIFMKTN